MERKPIQVELTGPPPPAPSPWAEPTRHLRDVARWITGGVIATAAAVASGSSLTRLGSLDPVDDRLRLALALAGLAVAMISIAMLMRRAMSVLNVESATILDISLAEPGSEYFPLKSIIEDKFGFERYGLDWTAVTSIGDPMGDRIEQAMPYFRVKLRFDALIRLLPWSAGLIISGMILFAWAANPPAAPAAPRQVLEVRLVN